VRLEQKAIDTLRKQGLYQTQACDRCGSPLGFVAWVHDNKEYCSRACRDNKMSETAETKTGNGGAATPAKGKKSGKKAAGKKAAGKKAAGKKAQPSKATAKAAKPAAGKNGTPNPYHKGARREAFDMLVAGTTEKDLRSFAKKHDVSFDRLMMSLDKGKRRGVKWELDVSGSKWRIKIQK